MLLRGVERGHPLFGPACELIRAEALIRLTSEPPLPSGLLALGQRNAQSFDTRHGSELLHLPRPGADPLHGPVADPLTDRSARSLIAARWHDHLLPRAPPLRAYGPRLCRHRPSADRLPRRPSRRARSTRPRWPRSAPRTCAPSSTVRRAAGPRQRLGGARAVGGARLPRLRRGRGGARGARCRGSRAPKKAAQRAAADLARRGGGAGRGGGRGREASRGSRRATSPCCSCSTARACASPRRSA